MDEVGKGSAISMLLTGMTFQEDSYQGTPFRLSLTIEDTEWGTARGRHAAGRSPIKFIRSRVKGRPDPGERGRWAREWSRNGWDVQLLNEPSIEGFTGDHPEWFLTAVAATGGEHKIWLCPETPKNVSKVLHEESVRASRGILAHTYGNLDEMKRDVAPCLDAAAKWGRGVCVSEINFAAGRSVDLRRWHDDHLLPFLDWCDAIKEVVGVIWFAYKWVDPDWPGGLPQSLDAEPHDFLLDTFLNYKGGQHRVSWAGPEESSNPEGFDVGPGFRDALAKYPSLVGTPKRSEAWHMVGTDDEVSILKTTRGTLFWIKAENRKLFVPTNGTYLFDDDGNLGNGLFVRKAKG